MWTFMQIRQGQTCSSWISRFVLLASRHLTTSKLLVVDRFHNGVELTLSVQITTPWLFFTNGMNVAKASLLMTTLNSQSAIAQSLNFSQSAVGDGIKSGMIRYSLT